MHGVFVARILHDASMRPRVFPAEDIRQAGVVDGDFVASMRPRVFPAEDAFCAAMHALDITASMRPRVFPAEDARNGGNGGDYY